MRIKSLDDFGREESSLWKWQYKFNEKLLRNVGIAYLMNLLLLIIIIILIIF